jgi:FixJ family two-component response regulator
MIAAVAFRPNTIPCNPMHSTVCIVDDNEDVRQVLARIVRSVGLDPELYDSAEAFLRRGDGVQIGCLLLDIQLGGMSGLELLAQLSAKRARYPVFLISGVHDAQSVAQAKAFKAIVVDKPFDARKLAQRVLASVRSARA